MNPMSPRDRYYPMVDYRSHPAFSGLDVPEFADAAGVAHRLDAIDGAFAGLVANECGSPEGLDAGFNANVAPLIDDLNRFTSAGVQYAETRNWIANAMDESSKELADVAMLHGMRSTRGSPVGRVGQDLERDGMSLLRLDPDRKRRLARSVDAETRWLKSRAGESGRIVATMARYSDAGVLLDRLFRDEGVYEALAAYKGSAVAFTSFSVEYSHERQSWWKGCYSDVGLAPTKTSYMHYDYGCRYPKAIVTLSEVGPENGPTSFIPGSHRHPRSEFSHAFVKALDYRFWSAFGENPDAGYHRKQFSEPGYRKFFLAIPGGLRGCSHFGEDVLDGSELSEELLAKEVRITTNVADGVVFDGDYGIHRGARVIQGERMVFQVIFTVREPDSAWRQAYLRSRQIASKWRGRSRPSS